MLTRIEPPFFEMGPKNYMFGSDILEMARLADEASAKYDVRVIFTAPYANIESVASRTKHIYVFAPHMDDTPIGRGLAGVLPESIKAAGAQGVFLNHCERPLTLSVLYALINRARSLNMYSIACADSLPEVKAVAILKPDIIVAEPTDLIGSGTATDTSYVMASIEAVRSIDPEVAVLVGGGISSGADVYRTILAGADATGCSSGIFAAKDPVAMMNEMLSAVREAWNERHR